MYSPINNRRIPRITYTPRRRLGFLNPSSNSYSHRPDCIFLNLELLALLSTIRQERSTQLFSKAFTPTAKANYSLTMKTALILLSVLPAVLSSAIPGTLPQVLGILSLTPSPSSFISLFNPTLTPSPNLGALTRPSCKSVTDCQQYAQDT